MYCLEFLDTNFNWLQERVALHQDEFLIFDLPGQLELFLNSDSLRNVLHKLKGMANIRLKATIVELFDSHYIQDPSKFLSACTYSLVSMVNLEHPQINVLSKIDLLTDLAGLDFSFDFYTECNDFDLLSNRLISEKSKFAQRFSKLSKNLCEVLGNYRMAPFFRNRYEQFFPARRDGSSEHIESAV